MKFKSIILSLVLLFYIVVSGDVLAKEKQSEEAEQPIVNAADLLQVSDDDMVIGSDKAKITIIEYASMTCSHCADFHKNTYLELKEKYIDTGKVRFVFRAFPLDEVALRASMLARCAGKEKFFKFNDVLFSTQSNWAFNKNYLEVLSNIGKLGGLSGEAFDKCIENVELEEKILKTRVDASKILGVRATPSFFINGVKYKGSYKIGKFSEILDNILNDKDENLSKKN